MEVSNYLNKSNFSRVMRLNPSSELNEERMSDEKVETVHKKLLGFAIIEDTLGCLFLLGNMRSREEILKIEIL